MVRPVTRDRAGIWEDALAAAAGTRSEHPVNSYNAPSPASLIEQATPAPPVAAFFGGRPPVSCFLSPVSCLSRPPSEGPPAAHTLPTFSPNFRRLARGQLCFRQTGVPESYLWRARGTPFFAKNPSISANFKLKAPGRRWGAPPLTLSRRKSQRLSGLPPRRSPDGPGHIPI